ncbi:MAG: EF-P lysine aminoacylase GenX [Deltaproteobacteria bacterium]|nr:EF-P lysine aminoacylase GenX [Deltaproteobacteria bacterium]MCF8119058.1 EF-P lysine aminoacylase GenX [Deltaproteobacteria bacterium]
MFRAALMGAIRSFFSGRGYLEVDTPHLLPTLAPEIHIRSIAAEGGFLQTSPELCMKRLLAADYGNIFQICHAFRKNERGDLHLPEFSLLEWYHTHADYTHLMTECEDLLRYLSHRLNRGDTIRYQGRDIALQGPWERLSVETAFHRYAPVSVQKALEADCFDEMLVRHIEPHLGVRRPTILYDYPAPLAALARLKPDNPALAERFELYVAGIELANGFSELIDPVEQRQRFERESAKMCDAGMTPYPMPEEFLSVLGHMPETAGIALGVDRLAMVLWGTDRIDDVAAFTPEAL